MSEGRNNEFLSAALLSAPLILSLAGAVWGKWLPVLLATVTLYALLFLLPVCRHRESLWAFVISSVSGIPVNVRVCIMIFKGFLASDSAAENIAYAALTFCAVYAVEQILLGVTVRLIWRKQYRLSLDG